MHPLRGYVARWEKTWLSGGSNRRDELQSRWEVGKGVQGRQ
jgi:hypothetical protein